MRHHVIAALLGTIAYARPALAADPQYMTIKMEIDVARPAAAVWATVGGYCDISKWLDVDCGFKRRCGIGPVRSLRGGQVTEIPSVRPTSRTSHAARARGAVLEPVPWLRKPGRLILKREATVT